MNDLSNSDSKAKRIKYRDSMEVNKMEIENDLTSEKKKSNFSSSGSNGSIARGNSANSKGDIKKLVIKNFKSNYILHARHARFYKTH